MKLISKIFLKLLGWKLDGNPPPKEIFEKCVIICAPHTSNWDYPIALAVMNQLGIKAKYAFKKELMGFPFGPIFRALGGLSIDRSPRKEGEERISTVEAIADLYTKHDKLSLMIAPEGSRSLRKEWKTGFYYIALQAQVPICLSYLNFEKKVGGFGKIIHPTGDIHADLAEVMGYFKDKTARHPEKFSVDHRFYQENSNTTLPKES